MRKKKKKNAMALTSLKVKPEGICSVFIELIHNKIDRD